MIRVLLLEDERPALDGLVRQLARVAPDAQVVGTAASVEDATRLLAETAPDLVLADIQLADGLSLGALAGDAAPCPVVFCTAYDDYWLDALRGAGIDYLLKPIEDARLGEAIEKYRRLASHFGARAGRAAGAAAATPRPLRRFLVKQGGDTVAVPVEEIAYFQAAERLVTLVARSGARHLVDHTLAELEGLLEPGSFFRVNRALLARAEAVTRFRPYFKGRLEVTLEPPAEGEVIVSQENAARFKAWLAGAGGTA